MIGRDRSWLRFSASPLRRFAASPPHSIVIPVAVTVPYVAPIGIGKRWLMCRLLNYMRGLVICQSGGLTRA